MDDLDRMLICGICGAEACCGFDVTIDGQRMGDVGNWRCADHHPDQARRFTREEWAAARAAGDLYPKSTANEVAA